jgi:hypothetical protein
MPGGRAQEGSPGDKDFLFRFGGPQPTTLSVLAVGANLAPATGPWVALGLLAGGEGPEFNKVWSLRGPLSTPRGRRLVGGGTLFLSGFTAPCGATPAAELALLQAGEQAGCWELIDTDKVRPVPAMVLDWVRDGHPLLTREPELEAYYHFLVQAYFTSAKAFAGAARRDLTYGHLMNQPRKCRGEVVHLEGRLERVRRYDPPLQLAQAGLNDFYEGWIVSDLYGRARPIMVAFTKLPSGLHVGETLDVPVTFDGYFFKKLKAVDKNNQRSYEAPLVVGHAPAVVVSARTQAEAANDWAEHVVPVFLGVIGATVLAIIGLTFWLRRSDLRARERLLIARQEPFVEPTPDEAPLPPPGPERKEES